MEITQDLVRQFFDYKDGHLYWKVKKANNIKIGDKVGSINSIGYIQTKLSGTRYKVHRLVWIYHHGHIGNFCIDHIDSNRSNNKIENLRLATHEENLRNRKANKESNLQIKGVCFHKKTKKFQVKIDKKYLGIYPTLEEASLVAKNYYQTNHGEFWRI